MGQLEVTLSRIAEIQQRVSAFGVNAPSANPSDNGFSQVLNGMLSDTENASESSETSLDNNAIQALISDKAQQYGLDPNLAKAVVKTESNFNPLAVSSVGAQGLMQLMPQTAKGLGVNNSFNPEQNVDGGVRYLKSLVDKYQSTPKAVAAYNAGPGAVDKYQGIPPYAETQHYTDKVMKLYQQYSNKTNPNTGASQL